MSCKKRTWDMLLPNGGVKESSVLRGGKPDFPCPELARMPLLLTDSTSCEKSILRSSTAGEGKWERGGHTQGQGQACGQISPEHLDSDTSRKPLSPKLPCSPRDRNQEVDALPCHLPTPASLCNLSPPYWALYWG